MEDKSIVELYWARSEDAIIRTDEKYGNLCRTLAGRILADPQDVEECVNDTYLGLWNGIPPARPEVLSAYVAKITRNLAMKRITYQNARKRSAYAAVSIHELEECLPGQADPESELYAAELAKSVERFLLRQDYESRTVFLRRYWFCDSISEIAERFQLSENNVKVRLFRIRKKLRLHLIKEEWIDER